MTYSGRSYPPCSCCWDGALLCRFHDEPAHVYGSVGQNTGVLKLDKMAKVYAVFHHSRRLGVVDMDVSVMLVDPCLNRMSSMSNVHLSTLTGNVVYTWQF
jgi:hypothetical protein